MVELTAILILLSPLLALIYGVLLFMVPFILLGILTQAKRTNELLEEMSRKPK